MPAPAPAPNPPAAPGHRLAHPQAANDLLMYRLNRLLAVAVALGLPGQQLRHGALRGEEVVGEGGQHVHGRS